MIHHGDTEDTEEKTINHRARRESRRTVKKVGPRIARMGTDKRE